MSGFAVPFSSSPPSTPDSRPRKPASTNQFGSTQASHPSTTPAGAPPSSAGSFTPAGPPPSSVFGSSIIGSGNSFSKPLFQSSDTRPLPYDPPQQNRYDKYEPSARTKNGTPGARFAVPSSSPPSDAASDGDDEDDPMVEDEDGPEEESDMDAEFEDDSMAQDDSEQETEPHPAPQSTGFKSTDGWATQSQPGIPRGTKRSRGGGTVGQDPRLPARGMAEVMAKDSAIPGIAKSLVMRLGTATVNESGRVILGTEELVEQFYEHGSSLHQDETVIQAALSSVPQELITLWQSSQGQNLQGHGGLEGSVIGIGPDENAAPIIKAAFLGSLLLHLHHPPKAYSDNSLFKPKSNRNSAFHSSYDTPGVTGQPKAMPKVLLDWLDEYHNPYPGATADLRTHHPNPTSHINFWDIIFSSTLRGKFSEVIRIFKESDFKHARTASEDGHDQPGYYGVQLGNVQRVINRTVQILEQCPAMQGAGDWEMKGSDWTIFRRRVDQSLADLATFAEGGDRDAENEEKPFAAENFGLRNTMSNDLSLSRASRRAESKVPWTIYQNLKVVYGILLGSPTEITSVAQDWVEATMGLTAWWNGDDDEIENRSLMASRRSMGRSHARGPRYVDIDPISAYLQKLAHFYQLTNNSDEAPFQINSMSPVEVGLASVFEGNLTGVIGLLRCWSLTVASAVVEIASAGGWMEGMGVNKVVNGFNESDLMVLSYGQSKQELDRDHVLIEYAEGLFDRGLELGKLRDDRSDVSRDGWEVAIQVLGRLDDGDLANRKVGELLDQLELGSNDMIDKVLRICDDLGLADQARKISEKYADAISRDSYKYGTALLYYARAHKPKKVKIVLDLLISFCLVQSIAYPLDSDLDENLRLFIASPKQTLSSLSRIDFEAAATLQLYLSGYATLRKFYDLRDEDVSEKKNTGVKSGLRPIARKREAASALIAVINSAADNIRGGLYDEQRGAVVQVDGLLTLLGEAMVFVDQPKPHLSLPQTFSILSAIEDLQTVHPRVYSVCEDCLQTTLTNNSTTQSQSSLAQSQLPISPRATLKKTTSSMTGSSAFSLIGSEMLGSQSQHMNGGASMGSSGVLVQDNVEKGWDWRDGLSNTKRDVKGEDLLRVLRLGLAKDIARAWIE
ncbi:MAG: hypothetical protein M1827_006386 [Pycnora praestabilis]|nr:MAG: hypothetical protein M1827_006386 [Pycnora praestabilis]